MIYRWLLDFLGGGFKPATLWLRAWRTRAGPLSYPHPPDLPIFKFPTPALQCFTFPHPALSFFRSPTLDCEFLDSLPADFRIFGFPTTWRANKSVLRPLDLLGRFLMLCVDPKNVFVCNKKNMILVRYVLKMTTSVSLISRRSIQWRYSRHILIETLYMKAKHITILGVRTLALFWALCSICGLPCFGPYFHRGTLWWHVLGLLPKHGNVHILHGWDVLQMQRHP